MQTPLNHSHAYPRRPSFQCQPLTVHFPHTITFYVSPAHTLPFFVGSGWVFIESAYTPQAQEEDVEKEDHRPGIGGNVIKMGSLMRVKNREEWEWERDVFVDADADVDVLMHRIGSVKRWGVRTRRERRSSPTPSDVIMIGRSGMFRFRNAFSSLLSNFPCCRHGDEPLPATRRRDGGCHSPSKAREPSLFPPTPILRRQGFATRLHHTTSNRKSNATPSSSSPNTNIQSSQNKASGASQHHQNWAIFLLHLDNTITFYLCLSG
jgi:hypothetical protein